MTEVCAAPVPCGMSGATTGLGLSRRFYCEAVAPILADRFPGLAHSAALIGPGSEVLGYDDEMSRDHHWGPRVLLFVRPDDLKRRDAISQALAERLPPTFLGFSTSFGPPDAIGVRLPRQTAPDEPVAHMVEIHEPRAWFRDHLGFDPCVEIQAAVWRTCPQQRLLEATAGEVFRDGLGELEPVRRRLTFYPRSIWLELLAEKWQEFADEQPIVGRAGLRGEDLGSRLVAARQAQRIMELCLMMEHRYIPYSKWLEAAFNDLHTADSIRPHLEAAVAADDWRSREAALCRAAQAAIEVHNGLELTAPVSPQPSGFHDRPFRVVRADEVAEALRRLES